MRPIFLVVLKSLLWLLIVLLLRPVNYLLDISLSAFVKVQSNLDESNSKLNYDSKKILALTLLFIVSFIISIIYVIYRYG